jgi:hypothetical protein
LILTFGCSSSPPLHGTAPWEVKLEPKGRAQRPALLREEKQIKVDGLVTRLDTEREALGTAEEQNRKGG